MSIFSRGEELTRAYSATVTKAKETIAGQRLLIAGFHSLLERHRYLLRSGCFGALRDAPHREKLWVRAGGEASVEADDSYFFGCVLCGKPCIVLHATLCMQSL